MTLQQLLYVQAIVDSGSINGAANALDVSQSCLSSAVHDLEKECHFAIFVRSNRGVTLTSEGIVFLRYAREILEPFRIMQERYFSRRTSKRVFRVSSARLPIVARTFIELAERLACEEYEFEILEGTTEETINSVKNLKSELGIVRFPFAELSSVGRNFVNAGVEFKSLTNARVVALVDKRNPIACRKSVEWRELAEYPRVVAGTENSVNSIGDNRALTPPKKLVRVNDLGARRTAISRLNAYALELDVSVLGCEDEGLAAPPVVNGGSVVIGYVVRNGARPSELGELFLRDLKEAFRR